MYVPAQAKGTNSPFLCLFVLSSLSSLLIQMLISSRKIFTDIPKKSVLPAIWASLGPAELTCNINHHRPHTPGLKHLSGFSTTTDWFSLFQSFIKMELYCLYFCIWRLLLSTVFETHLYCCMYQQFTLFCYCVVFCNIEQLPFYFNTISQHYWIHVKHSANDLYKFSPQVPTTIL